MIKPTKYILYSLLPGTIISMMMILNNFSYSAKVQYYSNISMTVEYIFLTLIPITLTLWFYIANRNQTRINFAVKRPALTIFLFTILSNLLIANWDINWVSNHRGYSDNDIIVYQIALALFSAIGNAIIVAISSRVINKRLKNQEVSSKNSTNQVY